MTNELQVTARLDEASLDTLFRQARTRSSWQDRPVPVELIRELYDLVKLGPTSANLTPARFVFLVSPESRERLLPAMAAGNVEKTRKAPVTVLVAYDSEFHDFGGKLFPSTDVKPWFEGKPEFLQKFANQNANLQAAYLIVAARALGLAAGPMGGFNADEINKEFFPDGRWRTIVVINLGFPDETAIQPRLPRLEFEEAALIL